MLKIGHFNSLVVQDKTYNGLLLDGGSFGPVRLLDAEASASEAVGDKLDVFVYPDSKGILQATRQAPMACLGEVAWLEIAEVNDIGAFAHWGLPKDLFIPFAEQTSGLQAGKKVLVRVYLDNQSRLAGSMRLDHWVDDDASRWSSGQPVALIIGDRTELGYKAIIEHQCWGLLYSNELQQPLRKGMRLEGYIKRIRSDGRADLSLEKPGYSKNRIDAVAEQIMTTLQENDGYLMLNDKSSPAAIMSIFGVSKKVFKQALGALYKQQRVLLDGRGIKLNETEAE